MSQTRIDKLTPEQEALIPVYSEKWQKIAISTERINRQKAKEAIKTAYSFLGLEEPKLTFYDSPYIYSLPLDEDYYHWIESVSTEELWPTDGVNVAELISELKSKLHFQIDEQLSREVWVDIRYELQLTALLALNNISLIGFHGSQIFTRWALDAAFFDFCISILNCVDRENIWKIIEQLSINLGYCIFEEQECFIIDRPIKVLFNQLQQLHGDGEPAIEYADGFGLYAFCGEGIPEKYGVIPIAQWQAQWLLEEENAELRRMLIQGIGYERICQELQAEDLDTWQEYTLLKINNVDIEPVHLLKMTCPSTNKIHVLRVPPKVKTARKAIRWCNWGVDPEDFSLQT